MRFKRFRLFLTSLVRGLISRYITLLPEHEIAARAINASADGNYLESLVLYDYLAGRYPRTQEYKQRCLENISVLTKVWGKSPTLNTKRTKARGRNLRMLYTLTMLGHPKHRLLTALRKLPYERDRLALEANLHAGENATAWQNCVNSLLGNYGLRGLKLQPPSFSPNVMHNIVFSEAPAAPQDRGLVTICISAHNSAKTLGYAIESVRRQDYPKFELLVIDDASTDGTADVAKQFAAKDERIICLVNDRNRGTYYNRNLALSRARGDFFTTLDADDICHPERIPLQLDFLQANSEALGVFALWFRVDEMGRLVYRNSWGGVIVHEAVATLLFKREPVVSRVGYYDPVKISADTEYLERIKKVLGKESIRLLHKPLAIALAHAQSLTAARGSGIDNYFGLSKPRRDYRDAWSQWHRSADAAELFIPFPDADYTRPFEAPPEITV
jgi:glycosyltransferase involved in cell wall biosynthesis